MSHRTSLFRAIITLLSVGTVNTVGVARLGAEPVPAPRGVVPTIEVPTPQAVSVAEGEASVGGMATRVELTDAGLNAELSPWYRLAFVEGGSHLRVLESYDATEQSPQADVVDSQTDAWRVADDLTGSRQPELPAHARVRTGADFGSSFGLLFTLTYLDVLSPGALVGNLRVAGTGGIGADGGVLPVGHVEAKVAAALLTRPDVVFTPRPSKLIDDALIFRSLASTSFEGGSVSDWLQLDAYRVAGQKAAQHSGVTAFVVVHDIRQALAWLCGRTGGSQVCGIAQASASLPISAGRSW
jgi:hypothetical protein